MRLASIVLVAIVLVFAGTARAQAPGLSPMRSPAAATTPKRPGVAFALSLGGTAAGVGLYFIARDRESPGFGLTSLGVMMIGPSFGHWYAGENGTTGLAIRAGGAAIAALAVADMVACDGDCADGHESAAAGMAIIGGLVFAGGTIYDLATAPGAASAWNQEHAVTLVPTAVRAVDGTAPGLAVVGQF